MNSVICQLVKQYEEKHQRIEFEVIYNGETPDNYSIEKMNDNRYKLYKTCFMSEPSLCGIMSKKGIKKYIMLIVKDHPYMDIIEFKIMDIEKMEFINQLPDDDKKDGEWLDYILDGMFELQDESFL